MPIRNGAQLGSKKLLKQMIALMQEIRDREYYPAYNDSNTYITDVVAQTQQIIIQATTLEINRQARITNLGKYPVRIAFSSEATAQSTDYIEPNKELVDNYLGQGYISAYAPYGDTKLSICIRGESKEEDMILPLLVKMRLGTGDNAQPPFSNSEQWNEAQVNSYGSMFGYNTYTTGYKLFDICLFHPGNSYEFNLNVDSGTIIDPGTETHSPINIFIINPMRIAQLIAEIAMDYINPEIDPLPVDIITRIKSDSWVAKLPQAGGKFTITPNFSEHIGFIEAIDPDRGVGDTCVLNYNPDTLTFTIMGW